MKRFFTMALLCVLCATVSSALEFTSGDFTYSILEDETGAPTTNVAVVGCSLPDNSEVTIPSHVENEGTQYTVTKLTSLRNSAPGPHTPAGLHIPETVVEMDKSFMYYYGFNDTISVAETNPSFAVSEGILYSKDLTVMCGFPRNQDHIIIPSTVKKIKYGAASFSKISELHIPEGVETIETLAFGYASVLTSIALPNSLKKIESMAFLNCNISQVFIPANTQLDTTFDTPFTGCPIESFSINPFINGNYSVYDGCIYTKDYKTLLICGGAKQKVEIHPNTTSIGDYALHFCKNLTSIDIPETIENIGNYSFRYSGLKEIELPNSVTHIGRYAFENCDNLERVKLPNRINTIEAGTFAFCQNLKTMLIPENVTEIDLDAFTQCSNACIVIVNPETEISNSDYYFGIAATIYARGNTYSYLYNSYPELNNADRLNYLFDVLAILNGHMTIGPNSSFHTEFTTDFLWEPANGIQFDLTLPAGLKLTNFVIKDLNNSEDASGNPSPKVNFSYTQLENGDYRIIVFTTDGSMMNHGVYWNWEFESDETLTRSNILCHNIMLSIDNQEVAFADENMYVTGYDITMPEIETIEEGDTLTLPQNPLSVTYDDITYTWTTPTPQTISIDEKGVMTALKPGPASIEIYINDPRYYFGNGRNFTVTPALYGDSNESGAIDLADVVTTVNYILERNPEPFSFKKADVDKNGRINVVDVTSTVKLVLEQPKEENPDQGGTMRAPLLSEFSFAEPQLKQDGKRHVELILDTPAEYTALQTDIELPAGGHIERIALANGLDRHSLDYAAIDGTTSRVLVYSMALAAFPNERNTAVIDITLSDEGLTEESLIRASGNLACDAAGNSFRSAPVEMLIGTSAVRTVAADTDSRAYATKGGIITYAPSGTSIVICDTNGGIVADTVSNGTETLHALQTGIYIVSFGNGVTAKAVVR